MYLFEETQGIKNFSILQKLKGKFFNPPKKSKIFNPTKIQNKNFQSYENSNQKFSILRKLQKIFSNPAKIQKKIFPILRKFKIKIF